MRYSIVFVRRSTVEVQEDHCRRRGAGLAGARGAARRWARRPWAARWPSPLAGAGRGDPGRRWPSPLGGGLLPWVARCSAPAGWGPSPLGGEVLCSCWVDGICLPRLT